VRADRPSATAALVAAATIYVAGDERLAPLVPEGAAAWCARCLRARSAGRLAATRALSHPVLRWVPRLAERATVPGLLLHFVLRKRWIEDEVRGRLAQGCEQVVVVGAGFDTLGARLGAAFPRARFVEIDHPATQAIKRRALADGPAPDNLHLAAADLARVELAGALRSVGAYRRDAPTVFVLEGLLMYLTDAATAGVFAALGALQEAPGAVIFTVMEPAPDGGARFHNATPLVRRLLAAWSEPFTSTVARADAGALLARAGLRLHALADCDDLRARYLPASPGLPLARGELVAVAMR
jgi:methyltransferase (TIGR00027 family)